MLETRSIIRTTVQSILTCQYDIFFKLLLGSRDILGVFNQMDIGGVAEITVQNRENLSSWMVLVFAKPGKKREIDVMCVLYTEAIFSQPNSALDQVMNCKHHSKLKSEKLDFGTANNVARASQVKERRFKNGRIR